MWWELPRSVLGMWPRSVGTGSAGAQCHPEAGMGETATLSSVSAEGVMGPSAFYRLFKQPTSRNQSGASSGEAGGACWEGEPRDRGAPGGMGV